MRKTVLLLIIVIHCYVGAAVGALDGVRAIGDFAKKYLADDVLGGTDGWNGTGLLGDAAGDSDSEDFFKNMSGNLQYTTRVDDGGVWQQQDSSPSYFMDNIGTETSYTIEVSIKMEQPTSGVHNSYLWVENSSSQGLVLSINDIGTSLSGDPDTDNTDAFHTFRVAFDATADLFYVWRDGQLLGTTVVSNPGGGQRLIVGDGSSSIISGQVEYEYIAVDATGAYEPSDDPYCGQTGTMYLLGDVNKDCYVNLTDLSMLAQNWLECTHVLLAECQDNL